MRILVISDVSSFMKGGVPAETRSLLNWLEQLGHSVGLASHSPLPGCEQVDHYPICLGDSLLLEVRDAVNRFRPDFVHVICMNSTGTIKVGRALGAIPWALTMHSVPPHERKLASFHWSETLHYGVRALRFLANSLLWRWVFSTRRVPLVIAHSRYVADLVVKYGQPARRVALIPLVVEINESLRRHQTSVREGGELLVVTVGGFAHTKGQHDVIKALPSLIRAFPLIRFQMIGEVRDSSYVAYLEALARKLGVHDYIRITPDLDSAEKERVLCSAALYVQPSHEEGFCLAYAEAAMVVPRLIGTRTGAIAEMSTDDAGMRVVAPRDSAAIAAAAEELLGRNLPADALSTRRERLQQMFPRSAYLESHERIYSHTH